MRTTLAWMLALALATTTMVGLAERPPPAAAAECPDTTDLTIPGAAFFQVNCLDDLTTFSNPRQDRTSYGWGGGGSRSSHTLQSEETEYSEETVPGLQIEGWFEDDSCSRYEIEHNTFIPPCPDGHRRNGQFLIRVPNDWDGQHLLVGGTPGIRTQFASDIILSDHVMYRGWAYASQDKGNTGLNFFRAGPDETDGEMATWVPPAAIAQWAPMMERAAVAAQAVLEQLYGNEADLTYAAGISNGGYQTRLALERYPELFDGGVDWEGTLFTPEVPNLYTYIPPLLQAYPEYRSNGSEEAYHQLVHEGRVPPDSEPVWDYHYEIYWGTVASTYRPVIDPEYTNYLAAPRLIVPPGDPDAEYDYTQRPDFVRERMAQIANTGDIHGKPLLTFHGTLDALLPISTDSDIYARMVREAGHGDSFRYYVVEGGTHVDSLADDHRDVMRPLLPCFLASIDALDAWVVEGQQPPPSGFVPYPGEEADYHHYANDCDLPGRVGRVAGADRIETALEASRSTFGITPTVVVATALDFPDALAAAPLAAAVDGPVLLVAGEVTDGMRRELQRMDALEAIVVGGPAAVPDEVLTQLEAAGLTVRRVAGDDRYGTAAAIAHELGDAAAEAVVASGVSFPDALSVAPLAAASGLPILLATPLGVPPATEGALRDLGVQRTLVVGGPDALAAPVLGALPAPRRVSGPERYATSVAVAQEAVARGHTLEEVYVATGRNFPDALTAGPVAALGEWGAPPRGVVLLVDGQDAAVSAASLAHLASVAGEVRRVLIFGGTAAVGEDTATAIGQALGTPRP